MMAGRLLSFWDGIFSGAMSNFQGVKLPIYELEFLNLQHFLLLKGAGLPTVAWTARLDV